MKKILVAATAVGATIAGIILYTRKKRLNGPNRGNAATNAYNKMNGSLDKINHRAMHSMG